MLYPLCLGIVIALCGISSAARATLSQTGHNNNYCSVTTIYVTASGASPISNTDTFSNVSHSLIETQRVAEAFSAEKTTTITRTHTGFRTITFTVDISGVTRSGTQFSVPTSIRFLHDGIPTADTEVTVDAETTIVRSNQPSTVTEIQPDSGGGDVSVFFETLTVYPLKTLSPEIESKETTFTLGPIDASNTKVESTDTVLITTYGTLSSTNFPTMVIPVSSQPYITSPPVTTNFLPNKTRAIQPNIGIVPGFIGGSGNVTPTTLKANSISILPVNEKFAHPSSVLTLLSISVVTVSSFTQSFAVDEIEQPRITIVPGPRRHTFSPFHFGTTINIDISGPISLHTSEYFSAGISAPSSVALTVSASSSTETSVDASPYLPTATASEPRATAIHTGKVVSSTIPPLTPPLASGSCGEQGIFSLNFDDIPPLAAPDNSSDVPPEPIFSPYHHFYFSEGFVIVPPPKDPYLPASKPLLLEFLTESNVNVTRNHNNPAPGEYGTTGEIGNGDNLHWGCYTFHAIAASVGCDSKGPTCDWQFTGVVYNPDTSDYTEIITQRVSTASCPTLKDCSLMDVVFLESFRDIQSLRINVTVAGVPKIWWMDDLKLAWADDSCDAGLCRASHR